jgi:hypothetical protein
MEPEHTKMESTESSREEPRRFENSPAVSVSAPVNVNPPAPTNILYKDPNQAADAITKSYNYWTGKILGGMLRKRAFYAEADPARWNREFAENSGKASPWPFTAGIDGWAATLRWTRTWLPVAGGAFFLLALLFQPAAIAAGQANPPKATPAAITGSPSPVMPER